MVEPWGFSLLSFIKVRLSLNVRDSLLLVQRDLEFAQKPVKRLKMLQSKITKFYSDGSEEFVDTHLMLTRNIVLII